MWTGELGVMDQGQRTHGPSIWPAGHRSGRRGGQGPGREAVWLARLPTPGTARPGVGRGRPWPAAALPCDPVARAAAFLPEPLVLSTKWGEPSQLCGGQTSRQRPWRRPVGRGQALSGARVPGVQGSCSLLPLGPSCESPEEHLANICRISECISESRTTEISWTNTGLEEVYIFV